MIKDPYIGMPITMGNSWNNHGCSNCINGSVGGGSVSGGIMGGMHGSTSTDMEMPDGSMWPEGSFDNMYLGNLPIAMCYVPMQQWKNTYSLQEALERGTLFPELDLPFKGKRGIK